MKEENMGYCFIDIFPTAINDYTKRKLSGVFLSWGDFMQMSDNSYLINMNMDITRGGLRHRVFFLAAKELLKQKNEKP